MTKWCTLILGGLLVCTGAFAQEKQITFSPFSHDLDNNDNFSPDGKWLCYDTRETVGGGIENSQSVNMVNIETGKEIILWKAPESIIGPKGSEPGPAPGIGAVSFNHAKAEVVFIHGPMLEDVPARGPYDFPNRTGGRVEINKPGVRHWVDMRDIATDRDTTPGAHRGGTHRHEYSYNGNRIGFTYNDFLQKEYDRTVGYMEPHPDAPEGYSHYFAIMVPVVPIGTSKPGELEKAWGDSWVGRDGRMRAFIGRVRNADGETYDQSLFVADVPVGVDITTADAGSATRFPTPPKGITVRRLTTTWAGPIARGSLDGKHIAFYGKDANDKMQVFIIPSDGSSEAVQATSFPEGADLGVRWHPSGNSVVCLSNNRVAAVCVKQGSPLFGKHVFLTDQDGPARIKPVLSWDGKTLAYNKQVPTTIADGSIVKNYAGADYMQIFTLPIPDENGDGIADGIGQ